MKSKLIHYCILAAMVMSTGNAAFALETTTVEYEAQDDVLEGYLAYDPSREGKLPAVIVVHEWWGLDDHARRAANRLAALGYVAFALDMYGKGYHTSDPAQAGEWAGSLRNRPGVAKSRFEAAIDVLKKHDKVDPDRIAAMGYCFGGTVVLEMARMGVDLKGVVSFHGGLGSNVPDSEYNLKSKVLVLHGADDPLVPDNEVATFINEMRKAEADWQLVHYGGALHSFTNPAADYYGMDATAYDPDADKRSWEAMKSFFNEVLSD